MGADGPFRNKSDAVYAGRTIYSGGCCGQGDVVREEDHMTTNLSAREVEYFPRLSFERHAHLLKSARYHALRNVSKRRHRVITSCVVEDVHFRTRDRRLSLRFSFSSSAYPISVICIIGRVGLVVVRHASLFPWRISRRIWEDSDCPAILCADSYPHLTTAACLSAYRFFPFPKDKRRDC
jgi:hypothetical protein